MPVWGARGGCEAFGVGCDDGVSATDPKISSCCGVLASCDDTAEDTAGVVVTVSRELTAVDRPKGSSSSSSGPPSLKGLIFAPLPEGEGVSFAADGGDKVVVDGVVVVRGRGVPIAGGSSSSKGFDIGARCERCDCCDCCGVAAAAAAVAAAVGDGVNGSRSPRESLAPDFGAVA